MVTFRLGDSLGGRMSCIIKIFFGRFARSLMSRMFGG